MKKYITVDDAAKLLVETNPLISIDDLLEQAARGKLTLCTWFDGYYRWASKALDKEDGARRLKGYIVITPQAIQIRPATTIRLLDATRVYESFLKDDREVDDKEVESRVDKPFLFFSSAFDEELGEFTVEYSPLSLNPCACLIPMVEIEAMLEGQDLTSCVEDRQVVQIQSTKNSSTGYKSDQLQILNQASETWWRNAIVGEPDTQPKNPEVAEWLIKRGFSERTASAGATIIRPDWAEKGRKPVT